MPHEEDEVRRLRDLHEEYIWKVNAAVGEGREDLARRLADDYLDEAVRMMTDAHSGGCGRSGCAICAPSGAASAHRVSRRGGWWRLFAGHRSAAS